MVVTLLKSENQLHTLCWLKVENSQLWVIDIYRKLRNILSIEKNDVSCFFRHRKRVENLKI